MTEPQRLISRPSGRVLLIDDRGRTLLCHLSLPGHDDPSLWVTPGGRVEPGESFVAAARRELREETGLAVAEPGPHVWTRRHVFRAHGVWYESQDRFFLLRVAHLQVGDQRLEAEEQEAITGHRWWSVDEMGAATGEVFAPRRLAELLPPLVEGHLPGKPIEVGP